MNDLKELLRKDLKKLSKEEIKIYGNIRKRMVDIQKFLKKKGIKNIAPKEMKYINKFGKKSFLEHKFCPICGNEIKILKHHNCFPKTCGLSCRMKLSAPLRDKSRRKTLMERYGVKAPVKIPSAKLKKMMTCMERYGAYHPYKTEHYKEIARTYNTAKPRAVKIARDRKARLLYSRLVDKTIYDTKKQAYKSLLEKYPDAVRKKKCGHYYFDFYVPELKTYISYYADSSYHGFEPYNENDPIHRNVKSRLKVRKSEVLTYWCGTDILKRTYMMKREKRHLEFFSLDVFLASLKRGFKSDQES